MNPEDPNDASLLGEYYENLCLLFPPFKTCERSNFLKSVTKFSSSWSSLMGCSNFSSIARDTQYVEEKMDPMGRSENDTGLLSDIRLDTTFNLSSSSNWYMDSEVRDYMDSEERHLHARKLSIMMTICLAENEDPHAHIRRQDSNCPP
jgi:hypothetical protein